MEDLPAFARAQYVQQQYQTDDPEEIPQSPLSPRTPTHSITLTPGNPAPIAETQLDYDSTPRQLRLSHASISALYQDPQHEALRHIATQATSSELLTQTSPEIVECLWAAGLYRPRTLAVNDGPLTIHAWDDVYAIHLPPQLPSVYVSRRTHPTFGERVVGYTIHHLDTSYLAAHFDWRPDVACRTSLTGSHPLAVAQSHVLVDQSVCLPALGPAKVTALVWFELQQAVDCEFVHDEMADVLWESWCDCVQ